MNDPRNGAEMMDRPEVLARLLFPRTSSAPDLPDAVNFFIEVDDGVKVGCRFFIADKDAPNILFYHGNGETAADYDYVAPFYRENGLNLFVAEYRGYGMSGGSPTCSGILRDTDPIFKGFLDLMGKMSHSGDLYVMGRSLGSAPAIETACRYQSLFNGLIVESGFASVQRQLERIGVSRLFEDVKDPVGFGNDRKIEKIQIPTLVIHGEEDRIIPVDEGKALYSLSGAQVKEAFFVPNAGHNDLLERDLKGYMQRLKQFIHKNRGGNKRYDGNSGA